MAFGWSAGSYSAFLDQRNRPLRDLLAAVPPPPPGLAVDLGCGPGNSTAALRDSFGQLSVRGLDSSPDMLRAARQALPDVEFDQADIGTWQAAQPHSLILANAVLHWLPAHATLFPRLAGSLAPGGSLAVQMPDNLQEPSHVLMREVAAAMPFAARLAPALAARGGIASPSTYIAMLRPICARVDIWRSVYFHILPGGPQAVVDWFAGSALRPFLDCLDAAQSGMFLDAYSREVAAAYPAMQDGQVILPFPRLFIVATRDAAADA